MAKPNYAFEKRQRELLKKQKKAEKGQRKLLGPDPSNPMEGQAPAAEAQPQADGAAETPVAQ
ncbi:hypothetical protein [Inhella inkyongensis]|uniref:hypothetical protein n=1 Tax=Inhella inkyongensis TaxID=392593 RepID=UPI00110ECBDD|nr:hypothetical protein [Inhella inkyongensis]